MNDKAVFILSHPEARRRAIANVQSAPDGYKVTIQPPGRTLDQSARFHAMCGDIARSGVQWAGKPRTAAQWKVLLVSGHAVVSGDGAEMVPGLENEYVNIRESTALMSKKRSSSLIQYTQAFGDLNGVLWSDHAHEAVLETGAAA